LALTPQNKIFWAGNLSSRTRQEQLRAWQPFLQGSSANQQNSTGLVHSSGGYLHGLEKAKALIATARKNCIAFNTICCAMAWAFKEAGGFGFSRQIPKERHVGTCWKGVQKALCYTWSLTDMSRRSLMAVGCFRLRNAAHACPSSRSSTDHRAPLRTWIQSDARIQRGRKADCDKSRMKPGQPGRAWPDFRRAGHPRAHTLYKWRRSWRLQGRVASARIGEGRESGAGARPTKFRRMRFLSDA